MHWSTEQHMIWTCWLLASGAEYSKLLVMYSIGNLERSKIDSNYFYCKGDIFKDICVFKKMTKKIIQWVLGQSSSIFLIILTSQLRDSVKKLFLHIFLLIFFLPWRLILFFILCGVWPIDIPSLKHMYY